MDAIRSLSVFARIQALVLGISMAFCGAQLHAHPNAVAKAVGGPVVGTTNVSLPNGGSATYSWTAPSAGVYYFDYWGSINNFGALFIRVSSVVNGNVTLLHSWAGAANAGDLHEAMSVAVAGESFLVEFTDWGAGGHGRIGGGCPSASTDFYEPNDTCLTASPITAGPLQAFVTENSVDYYELTIPAGDGVLIDFPNGSNLFYLDLQLIADTDPALCSGLASNTPLAEGSPLAWTNTGNLPATVYLFVAIDPSITLRCAAYEPMVSITPATFLNFCDPMDPHSGGVSAQLSGSFGSGVGSDLNLDVINGARDQFGYFLVGSGFSEPGISFGSGRLCLSVAPGEFISRYNVGGGPLQSLGRFDTFGVFKNLSGTSTTGDGFDVPTPIPTSGSAISSGETWHFQMWFRDSNGGTGSTGFTNGLSVRF